MDSEGARVDDQDWDCLCSILITEGTRSTYIENTRVHFSQGEGGKGKGVLKTFVGGVQPCQNRIRQ